MIRINERLVGRSIAWIVLLLVGIGLESGYANSIIGSWQTFDDDSGEVNSIIDIYEDGGKIYGKIVKVFPREGEDPDPICDLCPGERKDQKVLGMVIMEGVPVDDGERFKGKILDPENGKTYRSAAWLENGRLRLRGYVAMFYRTQTWLPAGE